MLGAVKGSENLIFQQRILIGICKVMVSYLPKKYLSHEKIVILFCNKILTSFTCLFLKVLVARNKLMLTYKRAILTETLWMNNEAATIIWSKHM